eukprot:2280541-Rhodomonas_salina.3
MSYRGHLMVDILSHTELRAHAQVSVQDDRRLGQPCADDRHSESALSAIACFSPTGEGPRPGRRLTLGVGGCNRPQAACSTPWHSPTWPASWSSTTASLVCKLFPNFVFTNHGQALDSIRAVRFSSFDSAHCRGLEEGRG